MKIFKTILWTTLFWILVIIWLWVAGYFYPNQAISVIPNKIKDVVIEQAKVVCVTEFSTPEEQGVDVAIEETIPQQEVYVEEPSNEPAAPVEPSNSLLLPVEEQPSDVQDLQNRVANLENEYASLVAELQQIFATPALAQIIAQGYPVEEEIVPTYEETSIE